MIDKSHAFASEGAYEVGVCDDLVLTDASRERTIELTCRYPKGKGDFGLIVWCHGLGGSRDSAKGLTTLWASHGYAVVQPTFLDSIEMVAAAHPEFGIDPTSEDRLAWGQNPEVFAFMIRSMLESDWRIHRVRDVGVILDLAETLLDDESPFTGSIDVARTGVGGHSFGAYTSQMIGGVTIDVPGEGASSFRDERAKAVVLASGQGRNQAGLRDGSWDTLSCPMLNITGSSDQGATSDDPNWKREPFLFAPPGDKYQAFIEGADHGLGGISGSTAMFKSDEDHLHVVEQVTLAFWEAFLGGNQEAKAWLNSDSPSKILQPELSFERR